MQAYRPMLAIVFSSENCDEMCEMIEKINNTLSVEDENGKEMILKYTDYDKLKCCYRKELSNQ